MRILYNILYPLFVVGTAPFYFRKMLKRGNWQKGFPYRIGCFSDLHTEDFSKNKVIWLHAVSVGEANICVHLIEYLRLFLKDWKWVVSTTTATGMGELEKRLPSDVIRIYYPLDFPWMVSNAIKTLNPSVFILVEAEFWPNMLWKLKQSKIPVFLVNARISNRSFKGYSRFSSLFKSLFESIVATGVQSAADMERLRLLGFKKESLFLTGNMKYDIASPSTSAPFDVQHLLHQTGVRSTTKVILASSTHAGEEQLLAKVFKGLKNTWNDLFLILVPRHFERRQEVIQDLQRESISYVTRTSLIRGECPNDPVECLVVDTTGELRFFYPHADVVFVGKSLTAHGGQSPIEPAAYGKAMVTGPNMENFQAIMDEFVRQDAVLQIENSQELEQAIRGLLADPVKRDSMGQRARDVVQHNQGAVEKTTRMILQSFDLIQQA